MFPANNLDKYFEKLTDQNWVLIPLSHSFCEQLLKSAQNKLTSSLFRKAHITEHQKPDELIRNDSIYWLDPGNSHMTDSDRQTLQTLETLTLEIKNYFRISLTEVECHFSIYPPGHFYQRHRDVTALNNRRVFSFVIYLNPEWTTDDAGELVAYDGGKTLFKIKPEMGQMILFRSDIEHEVLPTKKTRYALSGWIRS